jgi:hypothetical protein
MARLINKALVTKTNKRISILDVNCISSVNYLGVPQTISKRPYLACESPAEYHSDFAYLYQLL